MPKFYITYRTNVLRELMIEATDEEEARLVVEAMTMETLRQSGQIRDCEEGVEDVVEVQP